MYKPQKTGISFFSCPHEDTESIFLNIRTSTAAAHARLILERQQERKRDETDRKKEIQKEREKEDRQDEAEYT